MGFAFVAKLQRSFLEGWFFQFNSILFIPTPSACITTIFIICNTAIVLHLVVVVTTSE